jgi:hypothetical protein
VVAAYLYRTRLFHWIQSLHHHAERNAK